MSSRAFFPKHVGVTMSMPHFLSILEARRRFIPPTRPPIVASAPTHPHVSANPHSPLHDANELAPHSPPTLYSPDRPCLTFFRRHHSLPPRLFSFRASPALPLTVFAPAASLPFPNLAFTSASASASVVPATCKSARVHLFRAIKRVDLAETRLSRAKGSDWSEWIPDRRAREAQDMAKSWGRLRR